MRDFFLINTLLFLRKSTKITINYRNINFSRRCYFLNARFFCINMLLFCWKSQNLQVTVEIWTFLKVYIPRVDILKSPNFWHKHVINLIEKWKNLWLTVKLWTFSVAGFFLFFFNVRFSCANTFLFQKKLSKFAAKCKRFGSNSSNYQKIITTPR